MAAQGLARVSVMLAVMGVGAPAWALKLVATTEDVASVAREVLGRDGSITTLANPSQDPHFVDPRPSLLLPMSRADGLLLVGLDLEIGWLPTLLKGCRNADIQLGAAGYIDASTFIAPIDIPRGPVDRSMGDIHPRGNPHYLQDPRNAVLVARGLAERFVGLDPAHADGYRRRAEGFVKQLQARMSMWEARLAPLKGVGVVSYHRSLNYVTLWAGMTQVGFVEPKPGIPPSPSHVAQLLMLSKARHVKVFAIEGWFPTATPQFIAEKCGRKLTVIPGQPQSGERYIDHLEEVVNLFAKAAN